MQATESGLLGIWSSVRNARVLPEWLNKIAVGATPFDEIFVRGNARLIKYRAIEQQANADANSDEQRTPLLILPSLVNRHYILDLLPGKSVVESFVANGFPVYMLTWLTPPDEDRYVSIEELFRLRILKAIEVAAAASPTGKVHLVGQCLGGTLAAIAANLAPEKIASLTLLTAPLDFESSGQLGAWAKAPGFDLDALVDAYGNIPARLLQTSFQFLKPSGHFTKLRKAFSKRADEDFMSTFIAMELWSNDAMAFPGECYRFLIRDLYQENRLVNGNLEIGNKRINLADHDFPVLDVVATDDHIVPLETRLPDLPGRRVTRMDLAGGHIGAIIGGHARKLFWPGWMTWLKNV
jgi:polyhydroxyalkanoate synthase subunit PhaC